MTHILHVTVADDVITDPKPTSDQMTRFGIIGCDTIRSNRNGGNPTLTITFRDPSLIYPFLQEFLGTDTPELDHPFTVVPPYKHGNIQL